MHGNFCSEIHRTEQPTGARFERQLVESNRKKRERALETKEGAFYFANWAYVPWNARGRGPGLRCGVRGPAVAPVAHSARWGFRAIIKECTWEVRLLYNLPLKQPHGKLGATDLKDPMTGHAGRQKGSRRGSVRRRDQGAPTVSGSGLRGVRSHTLGDMGRDGPKPAKPVSGRRGDGCSCRATLACP